MRLGHFIFALCLLQMACQSKPSAVTKVEVVLVDSVSFSHYEPDYDTTKWTEIRTEDTGIQLDLRYATTQNFTKTQLYACPRCFLRPAAASALISVQSSLQNQGLGLKLFDCYRPLSVQERMWDKVPDPRYVMRPWKGSMHNRGLAVDLTIVNDQGIAWDMGSAFDEFTERSHHDTKRVDDAVRGCRALLKAEMEKVGFGSIRTEWWHYSLRGTSAPVDTFTWPCH